MKKSAPNTTGLVPQAQAIIQKIHITRTVIRITISSSHIQIRSVRKILSGSGSTVPPVRIPEEIQAITTNMEILRRIIQRRVCGLNFL